MPAKFQKDKKGKMSKKILLIEDDIDIQKIYSSKLLSFGFEVLLASSSEQAFNLAIQEKPDLVFLDIMLPGKMNGFELLERLKENEETKKIPVVVITNLDTERQQALKIGATDYLIKANTDLNQIVEMAQKYT